MEKNKFNGPLHEMAITTDTDFWNDSCSIEELKYAILNGAVGATTNPVIVEKVLQQEYDLWLEPIKKMIKDCPICTEIDIAWQLNEAMAKRGANLLHDIYKREKGVKGRISIQTNPQYYRDPNKLLMQTLHFGELAENIQVKIPVSSAGILAIEEATFNGISINATICFSVSQALAVAEAVEKGLKRRKEAGFSTHAMSPVCTIMAGRVDDTLKIFAERDNIITNPNFLEWGGIAITKRVYEIYQEKGYTTRLLVAAYRNHYHWTEFIGGNMIETIPYNWQVKFNGSDIKISERINTPVDPAIVTELFDKFPEFRKMYEPNGMKIKDFDNFGTNVRTLRQFLKGYSELLKEIRNIMYPDPDIQQR